MMEKKKRLAVLVVALLLLAGCGDRGAGSSAPDSSSAPSGQSSSEPGSSSQGGSSSSPEEQSPSGGDAQPLSGEENTAATLIPGGEGLAQRPDAVFLLKEYGTQMKWMEANQISNLERGTPATTEEFYFLLLPKFVGSTVKVERIGWNGSDFHPTETLYTSQSTPNDYGLVLTSREPEGGPDLKVTVAYGGREESYLFSYDGKGDRPEVLIFPRDDTWENAGQ